MRRIFCNRKYSGYVWHFIFAGLFIGSSIIYFSGVKPLVLGVPLLGFVGFLTALILGVWLVVRIMREGRRK